jgi:hypothetical protein
MRSTVITLVGFNETYGYTIGTSYITIMQIQTKNT